VIKYFPTDLEAEKNSKTNKNIQTDNKARFLQKLKKELLSI